jgi:hypothetical protein
MILVLAVPGKNTKNVVVDKLKKSFGSFFNG